MGIYQYTDPQTGRSYNFEHAGDAPTNEDYAYISNFLQEERAGYAEKYRNVFGRELEEPDDGTAIGRGLARGRKQLTQAFGETLGTVGEQTGLEFLANYGQGVEERARQGLGELQLEQPARMQSTDVDSLGSALTYAGEVAGEQIPQLGLGLGAALAAPLVGATGFVGGAGAAALTTAPILFGNNIQRQEDEVAAGTKAAVDVGDALTATFGQAALEGVADKLLLGGLLRPTGKSLFTRTVSRAGGGASTEGLTEVGQQMLERAQAGLAIDSEDAITEYREAAIAGGLVGGGVRATGLGERGDTTPVVPEAEQTPEQEAQAALEAEASTVLADEVEPTVEAETDTLPTSAAQQALDNDPELATASDAEIRSGMDGKYNSQLSEEIIAQRAARRELAEMGAPALDPESFLKAPTAQEMLKNPRVQKKLGIKKSNVITDALLAGLGLRERSTLRDPKKKSNIVGKDLTDPEVQAKLRRYAKNPAALKKTPDLQGRVDALLGDTDATGLGTGTTVGPTGVGVGTTSRAESVAEAGRRVRDQLPQRDGNIRPGGTPAPDESPVGTSLSTPELDSVPARGEPVTLASPEEITPEAVADLTKEVDAIVTEPVTPVQAAPEDIPEAAPEVTPEAAPEVTPEAAPEVTPVQAAPEAIPEATPEAAPAPQAVPQAVPTPQAQAAIPGQELGTAQQNIPAPVPPAPRAAPVQGASLPQADLQAVDDTRDVAAQAQLDRIFENNRGKQPEIREYHDTQVDPRDATEVTTAVDKEGILELLGTANKDLDEQGKAAKLYFSRFRRPVDALAEMGAIAAVGPTQTIKKDYVKTQTFFPDGRKKGRAPQFAFYNGMTQKSAMDARKWVRDNMSPQAMAVTRDEAVLARRDTTKFSPSDAYIGVSKTLKSIQQKEDNAFKSQLNRFLESPEMNYRAPAGLDQSLRAEGATTGPVTLSFKPVKGQTAFDSYMTGMGFKKRKLPNKDEYVYFDPENDNKVLPLEEVQEYYDGLTYSQDQLGFLLIDPVHGLDMALLPSIRNALQRGDLQFALNAIASTSQVDRIRQIAAKLSDVVGTTKVQVVDDLSQTVGRTAAGLYDPETNTISIDATNGMNVHTVLHEMTHAATSASLANPSLPEVKQLRTIFDAVREQMGEVYGTANLDEFVAEAFSNPEFQTALTLTRVDGGKMSGWEKFTGAVRRIVRKLVGLKPKSPESALDEVDRIINGMLTPSPATRAAPSMLRATATPEGSMDVANSAVEAVPTRKREEYVQMASDMVYNTTDPALNGAKNVILGSLDSRILADVAKKKIPFAPELNILIRKMSGAMRKRSDMLDSMVNNYARWARKNRAAAKTLNNIIPKSTALRVDPSLPRSFYSSYKAAYNDLTTKKSVVKEFKSEKARLAWVQNFNANQDSAKSTKAKNMKDPDPQDLVAYDALRKQYNSMGKEGQAFYRQMRNFFQDTYDEILPALRARLEATIGDGQVRASAFEKLQDILMKESGIIKPYFPLMRKGKHRLQYTALNEQGQPEVFVEYYQNRRELDRAFKVAESVSASGTKPEYTRADRPMNFNTVPSSSFVYDILKTMEMSKSSFKDPAQYDAAVQSVVDLALDAMPERSFMQGFRRRKDVRGYIGDMTPTKVGDTEFDAISMMKEKGRDLNRQIVQIQASAEIEKFRNQLKEGGYLNNPETADIARKLDQIAAFAQKPNVARWSQIANSVGFNMTMGLNFSSAAITFFDVAMSAMPIISAEYGARNTASAYGTATRLFADSPKTRGVMVSGPDGQPVEQEVNMGVAGKSIFNLSADQLSPEMRDVRLDVLIEMGSDQGQANQSMTQESLEIGRDAPLEGVNKWTSAMFHHSERFNRETTLTAAYLLEVQKLKKQGRDLSEQDYRDAAQKAIETTEFTLGSTAAAGRPVWAQSGVGNVLFLFKRFAIAKYYMMYKLGHESIGTTNVERIMQEMGVTEAEAQQIANDRKIARAGLRNFLITTGVMAGAGGMPMMGAFGMIYNMFADDDEDDFEAALRKFTGEGIYGGLANELLGVDVANRIALNSLLYRPPLIDKDQSPLWTFAEQIGGPVLGITLSGIRGADEVWQGLADGDMQGARRGAEAVVPAAIRNISKGVRFYTEGATTRRGDPITEDINAYNSVMQALGFAPQAYIQQLEFNKNARRREAAVNSKRSKLLRRHNMALREGDRQELQKVRELINEYNAGLPEGADRARITSDTLQRSARSFENTTDKMRGGMTYTPFMESILEEYDRGFQGF
jgi:hypothetical protein